MNRLWLLSILPTFNMKRWELWFVRNNDADWSRWTLHVGPFMLAISSATKDFLQRDGNE